MSMFAHLFPVPTPIRKAARPLPVQSILGRLCQSLLKPPRGPLASSEHLVSYSLPRLYGGDVIISFMLLSGNERIKRERLSACSQRH